MVTTRKTAATKAATPDAPKTDAAGRRKATKGEAPLANYAEKAVTPVIQDFVNWLTEQTGVAVDAQSVYLASALRGTFQKSEGNQERIAKRAAEIEAERVAREQRATERAAAKVERERLAAEKAAAPKVEKAPAPAKAKGTATKTPAAAKVAAKAAPKAAAKPAARRRPAAKPTVAADTDI